MLHRPTCRLSAILIVLFACASALANIQYTVTPVGTLGGDTTGTGINDLGQVVGYSNLASGSTHAFVFDGQIHDLGTFGGDNSYAYGINNAGDMAIVSA